MDTGKWHTDTNGQWTVRLNSGLRVRLGNRQGSESASKLELEPVAAPVFDLRKNRSRPEKKAVALRQVLRRRF